MLLDDRRPTGLRCEICHLARPNLEASLQEAMFEAHHLIPRSQAGQRNTKLNDLALLCASCHRLLHKMMVLRASWVGIEEARTVLERKSS